jgi:excisionase family DNA binding protein
LFSDGDTDQSDFLTVEQAAERLGYSPRWVRQLLREKKLQGIKVEGGRKWLIPRGEIDRSLGLTSWETGKDSDLPEDTNRRGDLSQLQLHLQGSMHGPRWPSLSANTQFWVLRVRLENLSDKPLSFGDFYLEVDRDIPGDPEVHAWPHIGRDTYGSHGGVPQADEALDKLISLGPERPVVEGALRFQDDLPFDSDQVRLTLKVKGTGPHRGTEKSWELGRFR